MASHRCDAFATSVAGAASRRSILRGLVASGGGSLACFGVTQSGDACSFSTADACVAGACVCGAEPECSCGLVCVGGQCGT